MTNDLISREVLRAAVIEILQNSVGGEYDGAYECFIAINKAPTVKLDESIIQAVLNKRCMTAVTNEYLRSLHGVRPTGKWIYHKGLSESRECSVCGVWLDWSLVRNSYCPNCGADMRGGKNENN